MAGGAVFTIGGGGLSAPTGAMKASGYGVPGFIPKDDQLRSSGGSAQIQMLNNINTEQLELDMNDLKEKVKKCMQQ